MKIMHCLKALHEADLIKGRLKETLDSTYGWAFGFFDNRMTESKVQHIFGQFNFIQKEHIVKNSNTPTVQDALATGVPQRFFKKWKPSDQNYCVVVFYRFSDVVKNVSVSTIAGWKTKVVPTAVYEFWFDDESHSLGHRRVM